MFEVTIRTDDKDALQKLFAFLASLNFQVFRKEEETESEAQGTAIQFTVQLPDSSQSGKRPEPGPKSIPAMSFEEWTGVKPDPEKYKPGFGCMKGAFEMAPDFDEPLEDFKEYMY